MGEARLLHYFTRSMKPWSEAVQGFAMVPVTDCRKLKGRAYWKVAIILSVYPYTHVNS